MYYVEYIYLIYKKTLKKTTNKKKHIKNRINPPFINLCYMELNSNKLNETSQF